MLSRIPTGWPSARRTRSLQARLPGVCPFQAPSKIAKYPVTSPNPSTVQMARIQNIESPMIIIGVIRLNTTNAMPASIARSMSRAVARDPASASVTSSRTASGVMMPGSCGDHVIAADYDDMDQDSFVRQYTAE